MEMTETALSLLSLLLLQMRLQSLLLLLVRSPGRICSLFCKSDCLKCEEV